jgi:hypothetical protein
VNPGSGLLLCELPAGGDIFLPDKAMSTQAQRLSVLFARPLTVPGDGAPLLYSQPMIVPRQARHGVARALAENPGDLDALAAALAPAWIQRGVNEDDEPITDCWAQFEIRDSDFLDEQLDELLGDPPEDDLTAWLDAQPDTFWAPTGRDEISWVRKHPDGRLRTLGMLVSYDDSIWQVSANSCRRLEAMTQLGLPSAGTGVRVDAEGVGEAPEPRGLLARGHRPCHDCADGAEQRGGARCAARHHGVVADGFGGADVRGAKALEDRPALRHRVGAARSCEEHCRRGVSRGRAVLAITHAGTGTGPMMAG